MIRSMQMPHQDSPNQGLPPRVRGEQAPSRLKMDTPEQREKAAMVHRE